MSQLSPLDVGEIDNTLNFEKFGTFVSRVSFCILPRHRTGLPHDVVLWDMVPRNEQIFQ